MASSFQQGRAIFSYFENPSPGSGGKTKGKMTALLPAHVSPGNVNFKLHLLSISVGVLDKVVCEQGTVRAFPRKRGVPRGLTLQLALAVSTHKCSTSDSQTLSEPVYLFL